MTDLAAPVYVESARPVQKYYLNTDTNQIINDQMSSGKLNEPVKDDFDWSIETDGYKRKISRHEAQADLWEDNMRKGTRWYSNIAQTNWKRN